MDDRLIPVLGVLGLLGAFLVVFFAVKLLRRREPEKTEEEIAQEKHVEAGVEQGVLIRDVVTGAVYPRCLVCGGRATLYAPVSGTSWMDSLPLLNRLHSLAPRYVIVDDEEAGLLLCALHKKLATKKLEEFHAMLRAERAKFNSMQEDKVAQMDGGALTRALQAQYREAAAALEETLGRSMPKSLPRAKESSPITIVSSSSTKIETDDEGAA